MPTPNVTSVSPFYGASDAPHPMPLLSSQIELRYQPTTQIRVTAMEELALMLSTPAAPACLTRRTHTPTPARARTPKIVSFHPEVANSQGEKFPRLEHSPAPSESSLSSLEDEYEYELRSSKIPKPTGEAGRPGRGGYNLEDKLGWGNTTFSELKRFVDRVVKKHLDETKCRSLQEGRAVQTVVEKTLGRFPDLADFQNYWPVHDLIQFRLKYTSARSRLRGGLVRNLEK